MNFNAENNALPTANDPKLTNISIVRLHAKRSSDTYGLHLEWELNGSRSVKISGIEYHVEISGGDTPVSYPVTDISDPNSGEVNGIKLDTSDKKKRYSVKLAAVKNGQTFCSEDHCLPIYGFSNLRGKYFKGRVDIRWDSCGDEFPFVFCRVYRDGGLASVSEVRSSQTNMLISVPEGLEKIPVNANVFSSDGDRESGFDNILRFFSQGVEFKSFEREGDSLRAKFDLYCSDEESGAVVFYLCAVNDGEVLYSKKADPCTVISGKGTEIKTFEAAVGDFYSGVMQVFPESIRLGVIIEYSGASTLVLDGISCMPLAAPTLIVKEYTRGGAVITVDFPLSAMVIGYAGSDGNTYYTSEISVDSSHLKEFSVRPIFKINDKQCTGIRSNVVSLLCDSFFADTNSTSENRYAYISYRSVSDEAGIVSHGFKRELFCSRLQEEISSEHKIITLAPVSNKDALYTLTLNVGEILDADDNASELNGFFRGLFGIKPDGTNNVTPAGFYEILDAIIRMCRCKLSDTDRLARNFAPQARYCSVLPGDMLQIETSVYVSQTDPDSEKTSGYTLAHTARYYASLSGSKNSDKLIFDPFVSGMLSGISNTISADNEPKWQQSGILDIAANVNTPYLCIIYPVNYYSSDRPASTFPYDNVSFLGNASYSLLLDDLNEIVTNCTILNSKRNVFYFNGRSSVTIMIQVYLNGRPMRVPVGTTVYTLISQTGGACCEFKMRRLNSRHEYCPVFIGESVCANEIVLISGDMIEV